LKNAIIPIVGGLGLVLTGLFTGAVITERIFSYPGIGDLFVLSINRQDWPIVNALTVFFCVLAVVGVFLGDLLLTIVDPRIRIK
jgi:ABC-type dipeptide/oligopeptide/nickel transport system permease component